ncbi:disulfide bond formation protein DsbA [Arcobacter venerupis]|uniref:thioredoxin domain-containing protein n=1 Tax=Arcobacter venerupis TaxID=1054033 RepID=UPI000FEBDF00|nr:thioredoxin domain-containing protein [Arcobacter venerupis]RWS49350.1 disulfide bond formation protein DsbA [Arcobacter venerupis]
MNKFSTILSISVLLTSALYASSDEDIISFEQKRIAQNPNVKIKSVKINTKKELPLKGWSGYILDVEANVQGKDINAKDILFSDGKYISLELIDAESGKSLKDLVTPNLTDKYYDKSKIIAGNPNAKNKLVIFSDPLCPFCKDFVPEVIKYVNKNSDSIVLYYYHFPLTGLHPAAEPMSKIIEVAKEKGMKDVELKVYEKDWEPYFTVKSTDEKVILDAFNKEFKTSIKLEEISAKKITDILLKDLAMGEEVMVSGTPTIFVNGEKDSSKLKYETLGKK